MMGASQINYGLLLMFSAAIIYDIIIKKSSECGEVATNIIVGDTVGGLGLGLLIPAVVMHSGIKNTLFLHDQGSDGETCSVPNKQQFKCRMYRNGQLVQ